MNTQFSLLSSSEMWSSLFLGSETGMDVWWQGNPLEIKDEPSQKNSFWNFWFFPCLEWESKMWRLSSHLTTSGVKVARQRLRKSNISSVQFSRSVVSDSLWPHESQHARPPCPSPTPRVHSDSRPLSQWCHLAISSSVIPFSSCPQSLPASEPFQMSQMAKVLEFQL